MRHILLVLAAAAAVVVAGAEPVLREVTDAPTAVSSGVSDADALFCDSWRLSVETANAGPWRTVPARCGASVRAYMEGERYASDSAVAAAESLAFAAQAFASGEGGAMPAWVFDVDETLLSNAPYYAVSGWGATQTSAASYLSAQNSQYPSPAIQSHGEAISSFLATGLQEFNETSFDAWVDVAKAPALPSSLKLYSELQGLGFHIILLTGRSELQRNTTEENLLFAGYHSWEKLILRQISDIGKTAVQYKSERRAAMEAQGFKILGNSGDQWSDLIGLPMATRSFKLPNPMYFIS
ncbi:acid phosphatase 1-like isoform X1 [Hordeum vulgare subsp. vulgare]|uniref:Acid phosphatase n=1 Tax=Hordeum vulgare subsp. vulgare TaxID=112509 RepID=A0A8I6YH25_HORVV|nr:acid phosphatase 1-like isoform X1 [Hordeum vulgare subsp. vulgare]